VAGRVGIIVRLKHPQAVLHRRGMREKGAIGVGSIAARALYG
jgi:hypothetical protein